MAPSRLNRRQLLTGIGGGLLGGGIIGSIYNTTLGFGTGGSGTNLHQQAQNETLAGIAKRGLYPDHGSIWLDNDVLLRITGDTVTVQYADGSDTTFNLHSDNVPTENDLDVIIANLAEDLSDLRSGNFRFEFLSVNAFFDRVETVHLQPYTTGFLRRGTYQSSNGPHSDVPDEIIHENSHDQIYRLKDVFSERITYDIPRFITGAIDDNIFRRRTELRKRFSTETGLPAMYEGTHARLLCDEIASIAQTILHLTAVDRQRPPLSVSVVHDYRHKHLFNGISTVQRTDRGLSIPTTFVDYTYVTLITDLRLRWLLGDGLDAFDTRHRADNISW